MESKEETVLGFCKRCIKSGFGFGLTSGVLTTLGLTIGLHAGTHSRAAL